MRTKLLACVLAGLLLIGCIPAAAASGELCDGIEAYYGVTDPQQWLDGALSRQAGSGAEWIALALLQTETVNADRYEQALLAYRNGHNVPSASTRLKYALLLSACGSEDGGIGQTLAEAVEKQGVMSRVFGLHLLNNGYQAAGHTVSSVTEQLLSMQKNDGGFAVTGAYGDVDVTAMTVQALAPQYAKNAAVRTAVDRALALLSERQTADGGFQSYGVGNPESAAQVVIALSALGIDAASDARFIKNGCTAFDAIGGYRLADGSYAHTVGGAFSAAATEQVYLAGAAYARMKAGGGSIFLLDRAVVPSVKPPEAGVTATQPSETLGSTTATSTVATSTVATSTTAAMTTFTTAAKTAQQPADNGGVRLWISIGLIFAAALTCAVLLLRGKRTWKLYAGIGIACAVLIAGVWCIRLETVEQHYGTPPQKEQAVGSVTLTIRCDTVPDKSAAHIPDDGVILATVTLDVEAGETVYDLLVQATAAHRIHLDSDGSGYVRGIANLYEFEFGELSGWVYHVNGVSASVGCHEYTVRDGDVIEWLYTCDLGEDVK